MNVGTRSLIFGVHQFLWHPLCVLRAWHTLYRSWPSWKELVCIVIHDWGYWGKAEMDDEQGERHPEWAANVAARLFGKRYGVFCLYHSRHYARRDGHFPSALCWADKLAIAKDNKRFYLLRARLSGEIHEYRRNAARYVPRSASDEQWFDWCREKFVALAWLKVPDSAPYINKGDAV